MPSILPKPSGPYHVGCTDVITKFGEDRSMFRLFYPAKPALESSAVPWVSDLEYTEGLINYAKLSSFSWIVRYLFSGRFIPASLNAKLDVANGIVKFPVVIFSHGLGSNRTTYSSVCMELASHGTVVASVEHADQSASATYYLDKPLNDNDKPLKKWIEFLVLKSKDPKEHEIRNKQVHVRADDCSKALDHLKDLNEGTLSNVAEGIELTQFKDKLDLDNCAIVGHSFGGGTSIAALSKDNRFKVAVALDSWMYPLDKNVYKCVSPVPILFINSEFFQWPANVASMKKLDADTLNIEAERKMVTLKGAAHMSQSDILMFFGWNWLTKRLNFFGSRDPVEVMQLNHELMMSFIGKHLRMQCGQELDQLPEESKDGFIFGSNIELDEEKLKLSKQKLQSSL